MTKQETICVLTELSINYPDTDRNLSDKARAVKIEMWASAFADEPYELVTAAVRAHAINSADRFAPNIGQVKEAIRKLLHPDELTEGEAWALVLGAVKNSGYEAKAEFDKLPPIVQRTVGSPNQLREWGMMDSGEFQSVVASNFRRSYRAIQARAAEQEKTPERIRAYFAALTKPMPEAIEAPEAPALEAGEADEKREAMTITPEAKAAALAKIKAALVVGA